MSETETGPPEMTDFRLHLPVTDRARLEVMSGAKGVSATRFLLGLIDQADREQFGGRAAQIVAEQARKSASAGGSK